jgi:hypothetical protein
MFQAGCFMSYAALVTEVSALKKISSSIRRWSLSGAAYDH